MEKQKLADLVGKAPLFSRVDRKGLLHIADKATTKEFSAGKKIVSTGATGAGFYLILSGAADVMQDGRVIAQLGDGDFFGEMALLDGAPRSADVLATKDTVCMVITRWEIKSIIALRPDIALNMLEELVQRLRKTNYTLS